MMKVILAVLAATVVSTRSSLRGVSSRYTRRARKTAYTTAITAASVGVTMPPKIPPRMMTGKSMTGMARQMLRRASGRVNQPSARYPRRWATTYTAAIMNKPISTPGTTPPRNSRPTEIPVIPP